MPYIFNIFILIAGFLIYFLPVCYLFHALLTAFKELS